MKPLTIGQVARQAEVGVETIRFYERRGLLEEPSRKGSGYRQYSEDAIARLRFIKCAKELGFTLKEIGELLALRLETGTSCAQVKQQAQAKIADIEAKIESLRRMREALANLTRQCSGRGPLSRCPILEALGPRENNQ